MDAHKCTNMDLVYSNRSIRTVHPLVHDPEATAGLTHEPPSCIYIVMVTPEGFGARKGSSPV